MTDLPWGWTPEEIDHLNQKGERVGAVLGPEKRMLGAEVFDVMGDLMTTYAVSLDDLFRGIDLDRPRS